MPSPEHSTDAGWWVCVPGLFAGEWHLHSGVTLMATVGMLDCGFEEVQS